MGPVMALLVGSSTRGSAAAGRLLPGLLGLALACCSRGHDHGAGTLRPAPPPIVPHSPSKLNNRGLFDTNTGESSLFLWTGGGPHNGQLLVFETINSRYPSMAFGPATSYFRLRYLDSGVVIANISESQRLGFGSAFMDHDHGRVWLFGCARGDSSTGVPANRGCGVLSKTAPDGRGRPWDGTVWALWSTDLMNWEGPALTDVAWSGPNTATARVRGPTDPSLPTHR